MNRWRCGSFLLILAVGCATAEIVKNTQEELSPDNASKKGEGREGRDLPTDTGKIDYESALRPALLQKRSIANIARLLLGGNVPPNHPLVKYPEPKAWNLASNIVASLPGGALSAAASSNNLGWGAPQQQTSALENIQQLFQTKAKIIPYTGQVATGLTGLATVKGDLLRQIHSISTQAIAQAAAEAAARALASAAAAHAVTNSIHSVVGPGAQTGIKGGWSSYQNSYVNPGDKPGPGDQPGPPYHSSSAYINHYQAPPSPYNPYSVPATTPSPLSPTMPSPVGYQQQPQNQAYQNGYYTLYNTQNSGQTPYTPAPPVGHARPTLSPNTLIATTPSGYSPSLSQPLNVTPIPFYNSSNNERGGRSFFRLTPPVIVVRTGSNNAPLTSFRRTVPVGFFGRNAPQPSSTSSLLSTISSLLSASTAAYNAAFTGDNPGGVQQHPPTLFSNLLSSAASSPFLSTATAAQNPNAAAASILSSAANAGRFHNGYGQQSANSVSQGSGNYGSSTGSGIPNYVYNQAAGSPGAYGTQTGHSSVHSSGYPFNQHASSNAGANYAQPGTNPYSPHSVQSSSQFGTGNGAVGSSASRSDASDVGSSYPSGGISGGFSNAAGSIPGSGYTGFNGGAGSSAGHAGGWNTQYSGSSPSTSSWPSSGSNLHTPGYAGQTAGNFNNPSGGFGGAPTAQFSAAAGSTFAQQAYPTISQNAYQSSTNNAYAQAQSFPTAQYSTSYQQQSPFSVSYGAGGVRNPNLNSRFDSHDLSQSASIMGSDYEDDEDSHTIRSNHHSYQPAQRRHPPNSSKNSHTSSRYPSPAKKRPSPAKKPSQLYNNHANLKNNFRNPNNGGQRVIPTGNKKGSHFASSLVDSVDDVDAHVDVDNYEAENSFQSQEYPNTKNRWRSKNPSGQRPHSFHNHNPNGRWSGKETVPKQTSPANVRGKGPKRVRPQSGQSTRPSKNHRNKKGPVPSPPSKPKKTWRPKKQEQRPKAEKAHKHGGRVEQQKQQSGGTQFKSRDVYTTLPEYVFRVGERTDVFLRPSGKRKHGDNGRGVLRPRVGETLRSSSSGSRSKSSKKKESLSSSHSQAPSRPSRPQGKKHPVPSYPDEEETSSSEEMEKSATSYQRGPILKSVTDRGEDEEFVSSSEAVDETSRSDVLSAIHDSVFSTASEEFDPEEREAFVDDVYAAEDHSHSHHHHHPPHRRQEHYGEEGDDDDVDEEDQEVNQEGVEEDPIDKK